ncbi:hypothetical protein [Streptomyces sp. NPDC101150]|uniref:hypothetical protein n=1 Tax=Streptomyces sp. NPDC101150 TaxID=3366114 RepID=UPI0037FB1861
MSLAGQRAPNPGGVTVRVIEYRVDDGEVVQPLRSTVPALVRQEIWAHLVVHNCLNRIITRVATGERIDPGRLSFAKVLKHVRRSVIRQTKDAAAAAAQGAWIAWELLSKANLPRGVP